MPNSANALHCYDIEWVYVCVILWMFWFNCYVWICSECCCMNWISNEYISSHMHIWDEHNETICHFDRLFWQEWQSALYRKKKLWLLPPVRWPVLLYVNSYLLTFNEGLDLRHWKIGFHLQKQVLTVLWYWKKKYINERRNGKQRMSLHIQIKSKICCVFFNNIKSF